MEEIPTLETAFVEDVVGCEVVAPEDIVPAEFCNDDAESAVPDAGEPSEGVDAVALELVGMCVDERNVVLIADGVDELVT